MKQTNNAIKFLMAQYRAIFQNAYFKGLATAAVLTAGLAVGQAQAAAGNGNLEVGDTPAKTTLKVDGTTTATTGDTTGVYKFVQVSGGTLNLESSDLTITGGATGTENIVKGDTTAAGVLKLNSLTINAKEKTQGLQVEGTANNGAELSVKGAINLEKGTLKVLGTTNSGTISASAINIGSASAKDGDAILALGTLSNVGNEITTEMSKNTAVTLNKGALVKVGNAAAASPAAAVLNAGTLTINAGAIETTGDNTTNKGGLTVNLVNGAMNDGSITVKEGDTLEVAFAGTDVKNTDKKFNFAGGKVTNAGTITLTGSGTYEVGNTTFAGAGDFKITGSSATDQPTVKLSLAKLQEISDSNKLTIASGTAYITDAVDLSKDLTFGTSAAASQIKADSGTKIQGNNIAISDNVGNGSEIEIDAKQLTLGKEGRTAAALTVASLKAEDVTFVNKSATEGYTLAGKDLTLQKITKDKATGKFVAGEGTINGDLILSGSSAARKLIVDGGKYTANGDIDLGNSGSIELTNTSGADLSNLTFAEGTTLSLNAANSQAIAVNSGTELDISNATIALTSGAANVAIDINAGTLKASGKNINDLTTTANSQSGSLIGVRAGGTLNVVDNLTIASSLLTAEQFTSSKPAAAANKISFDNATGGKLIVDGKLTVDALQTAGLSLKENVDVKANELALNVSNVSDTAVLKSGGYYVFNGLDTNSTSTAGVTVSGGAVLNLGEIQSIKGVNVAKFGEDTTIAKNLTTNTGDINVNAGEWKAKSVAVSGTGSVLTIGNDGSKLDVNGNEITASLKVQDELSSKSTDGVLVESTGSLLTKKIVVDTTGDIVVKGNMTISGEKVENADDPSIIDSYGVDLAASAISVKKGGSLTLGEDATAALKLEDAASDGTSSGDGIISNVVNQDTIESFKQGALASEVGSTVNLSFAANTKFDKAGLDSLKSLLFGAGGTQLKGFLNIGDAEIKGLVFANEDNTAITFDELNKFDGIVSSITNETLKNVQVTQIENGDNIRGSFGSLSSEKLESGDSISILDSTTLSNAAGNKVQGQFTAGKGGALLGLNVANGALKLENGGAAGKVTLAKDSEIIVNGGKQNATTTLDAIVGVQGTAATLEAGSLVLKGESKVGNLSTALGTTLTVEKGDLSLLDNSKSSIAGTLSVAGDLLAKGKLELLGNTTAANTKLEQDGHINGGSLLTDSITIADGKLLQVGSNDASGVLRANTASLKGGSLLVDPNWEHAPAYVAISKFADGTTTQNKADAGYVKGDLVVAKNSALFVGLDHKTSDVQAQQILNKYKINKNDIGAYAYLNDKLTLSADSKLIVDGKASETTFKNATTQAFEVPEAYSKVTYNSTVYNPNAYLADNSAVIVGDNVLADNTTGSAVHFDTTNASIYVGQDAVVYLDGQGFAIGTREINLFTDNGTTTTDTNGVLVLGNNLRAETLNGLMYIEYEAGKQTSAKLLQLNKAKADNAFNDASAPMKDFLVTYASADLDWKNLGTSDHTSEQYLVDYKVTNEEEAKIVGGQIVKGEEFANNSYVIKTNENGEKEIYKLADNSFLHAIVTDKSLSGVAADQAARMGDFGGAAETALVATSTTYDAVAGRFGMGQQAGTMTIANNGQGSGLWVTPVYKSHESDGLDADGLGYGSDITLYGVALGGDVTLANGVRVGAMFNVGSGDADGQGAASVVSNDFDYFGGSIYAGYAIDNFSIVGDVSYTTIDSDVEANTTAGKTSTSFDTSALSVGVTGQYALKVAEMDVTPHAGMRFTRIDMDDYTIESADFGKVGQYNASSANVFSIPVGVTISKEYVTDTWTVKPSFDLTLTGNFGDDTVDGTVSWTGVSNYDVSTKAEFVDNFTYGASVGIAAKTGNFGLGLGLNYTGSSNTDEFGVNANARYMF